MSRANPTIDAVLTFLAGSTEPQTQRQIRGALLLSSNQVQCALTRLLENGRVQKVRRKGRHAIYLMSDQQPPAGAGGAPRNQLGAYAATAYAQAPTWPAPMTTCAFGRPLLDATHAMEAMQC